MRRLAGLLLALPLVALAVPPAAQADTSYDPPGICPSFGPAVCWTSETHTPQVTVTAKGTAEKTYAHFTAHLYNGASSTVTHFTVTAFAPGLTAVAMAGSTGQGVAATCDQQKLSCQFGNLPSQVDASVDLQVQTIPGTTATSAGNTFTLSFDERANDTQTNGGKVDTVPLPTQVVTLRQHDGTNLFTFLPTDQPSTTLTTDSAGKPFATATTSETVVATTEVPAKLPQSAEASITRRSAADAGACLTACAMPDWVQVSLPIPTIPGGLATSVRVDGSLLKAVGSKPPVYYRHTLDDLVAALPECSATIVIKCVTWSKASGGDVIARVLEDENGFMRL